MKWIGGILCVVALLCAQTAAAVSCTGVAAWKSGTAYGVGALVTYTGHEYSCLQAHTSQVGWEPSAAAALWSDKGACTTGGATPTNAPRATATTAPRGTATATARPGATATSAPGSVLFHNAGTTSGWSTSTHEHWGTVTQVGSPSYKGGNAIKVTQIYDSAYTGRYHSEEVWNDGYRPGDQRFYGFAFYLPADWQFVNQSFNIAQFIADFTNTGCDDWMPTTMMWISGNQLSTRVKSGTVCGQQTTTFNNIATVTAGQWHRVEIQASWKSDASGFFKVWYDGTKVLERLGIPTTIADPQNRTYSFRVGMYANAWHDQHTMLGTQGTRSLYIDQVGIGTAFANADPAAW